MRILISETAGSFRLLQWLLNVSWPIQTSYLRTRTRKRAASALFQLQCRLQTSDQNKRWALAQACWSFRAIRAGGPNKGSFPPPTRKNPGIDSPEKWKTNSLRRVNLFPAAREFSKTCRGSRPSAVGHSNCYEEGQDAGTLRFS